MSAPLGPIDHDALRRKYAEERDKRLRPDGDAQYREPTGRFAHLLDDPYTEFVERDPVDDEVTVALIGGGFAGLTTGAALKKAGIDDIRIIEGGGDFGGVWYWNRYPGAMCDTAAMVYLPLLEETGYRPSMKYVFGPEIYEHARRIAEHHGLYDDALLHTEVTSLDWDDVASRWVIRTNRGDVIRARFVTQGLGPISRPKLPGIPGIETFAGHSFHTARWDYGYTGGSPEDPQMVDLADKVVAIIGTGATAVQCIPPLGRSAEKLFVFQRTPSSIDVRNNHPIDPDTFAALEPGWQEKWLRNFATLQTGGFDDVDYVQDGWTDIAKRIRDKVVSRMLAAGEAVDPSDLPLSEVDLPELMRLAYEESDDEKMTEIRARVDEIVQDPATAAALKPWYRQLCKRPCFHDEYLQTYNLPNVELVDTNGRGVERIDETGVWANGVHHRVDCIVWASGFEVHLEHNSRYETTGRGGIALSDHWADGMRTLHGLHVHGFPNMFIIGMCQAANLISNITSNLVDAGNTTACVIRHALDTGAASVEVTEEAEAAWVAQFESSTTGFLGNADCTPGYYNHEGRAATRKDILNASGYPGGPVAFFDLIEAWRNSGTFEGVEFT